MNPSHLKDADPEYLRLFTEHLASCAHRWDLVLTPPPREIDLDTPKLHCVLGESYADDARATVSLLVDFERRLILIDGLDAGVSMRANGAAAPLEAYSSYGDLDGLLTRLHTKFLTLRARYAKPLEM